MFSALPNGLLLIFSRLLYHVRCNGTMKEASSKKVASGMLATFLLLASPLILRIIPLMSIFLNQRICLWWSPCTRFVRINSACRHAFPGVRDAIDNAPGCLNFVAANEEC